MKLIAAMGLRLALGASPARCEDIAQVLQRSQQMRLDQLPEVPLSDPAAAALHESFKRVQQASAAAADAQLRVVAAGAVAETMQGRVIVMNMALAELPEICRLFLIAHELGHITNLHWSQRIALYRRFIPGEVAQAQTDAVAAQLGQAASAQSHEHEYTADAYAMQTLLDMGYSRDDLLEMFFRLGNHGSTATHPSTGKRLAQLRFIDDQRRMASATTGAR